jgi:rare lipoprotein A
MRAAFVGIALACSSLMLAACAGAPTKSTTAQANPRIEVPSPIHASRDAGRKSPYAPAQEDLSKRGNYTRGGLYAPEIQDSAPDGLPDVDLIPEPEVKAEPRSLYGNRSPYAVLGKSYAIVDDPSHYDEIGLASFYGNKFHGRRTSNLEVYDMYAFSAAHKTLPLPSYARVTNLSNGKSVIVRVNDRGPFHEGRIIDLSYAAAVKLGVTRAGTARVEVKGLSPGDGPSTEPARDTYDTLAVSPNPSLLTLPPGVHIATGKPRPASAIDTLVSALPIASANVGVKRPQRAASTGFQSIPDLATLPVTAPQPAASQRFDMRQDGRTMTADEFDAWMRARRMRVATGKPETSANVGEPAPVPAPRAAPIADEVAPAQAAIAPNALTFQVASFAARANAEHALAMLTGAGIDGARLLDADANGHKVWRLRVGPVNPSAAPELVARLQGLGFSQPQRVRE